MMLTPRSTVWPAVVELVKWGHVGSLLYDDITSQIYVYTSCDLCGENIKRQGYVLEATSEGMLLSTILN